MRLKMDNHYGTTSVTADVESKDEDVELRILKKKGFISKRIYYSVSLRHENNRVTLNLNEEQLVKLNENLNHYIESKMYKKRTDAKTSKIELFI